jgi:hypothetical protein
MNFPFRSSLEMKSIPLEFGYIRSHMETTLLDKNSMLSHNTEQWKVLGVGSDEEKNWVSGF